MAKKTKVEMEHAKTRKIARTLVRLKYSLAADEELNEVMDTVDKKFSASVLKGILKSAPDISKILDA